MEVLNKLQQTVDVIRSKTECRPLVGIVLGSGLGAFVKSVKDPTVIPYEDLPHFAPPSVEGHGGQLVLGQVGDLSVAVLQGRLHSYEGHSMAQVVYPIQTLSMLGIKAILLTNSAGGLNPDMKPGDFMVIDDHINLMGTNPLIGPNVKNLGPRFPDMTEAYDREMTQWMVDILTDKKISHWRGVYCGVSGPTYETPAEVRFLQIIGGSAVGMSTVPESITANHLGLRVAAMSCITNPAAGLHTEKLNHEEVTGIAKSVERHFNDFFVTYLGRLAKTLSQ